MHNINIQGTKRKGEENYMFHKHGSILPSKLYNFIVEFFWINYWTIQTKKTLTWIKKKEEIVCFIFISFMIYIMIRACMQTISRIIYVNFHLVHKLSTYFCSCSNSLWLKQVFANYRKRALNVGLFLFYPERFDQLDSLDHIKIDNFSF